MGSGVNEVIFGFGASRGYFSGRRLRVNGVLGNADREFLINFLAHPSHSLYKIAATASFGTESSPHIVYNMHYAVYDPESR